MPTGVELLKDYRRKVCNMGKKKSKKKSSKPRNIVAKYLPRQHKSVPFRDKTKYNRKDRNSSNDQAATTD